MTPASPISLAIRSRASPGGPALIPYITAGFPTKAAFIPQLRALAQHAAVIEVGVPFSDPMADGVTIQRSSRVALEQGVSLDWILSELGKNRVSLRADVPLCLMSYLNPLLSIGLDQLGPRCAAAGISGLIIPDLPFEESAQLRREVGRHGVGLVQLVSPVTPHDRARAIAEASDGFLYAVTMTGVTGASAPSAHPLPEGGGRGVGSALSPLPLGGAGGGSATSTESTNAYLARLRSVSPVPVCAGFGIRTREHVAALRTHADGAIIGSALIEAIERGEDAGEFVGGLAD
ncbi:MAG: tryptophan synthase subunit alpha [Phycisphaerales bacterium]